MRKEPYSRGVDEYRGGRMRGSDLCSFFPCVAFIWFWETNYTIDVLQRIAYLAVMGA